MLADDEKILLNTLPGLRDLATLEYINLQERYLNIIRKFKCLFDEHAVKETIEDKNKAIIFARQIFSLEDKLKVLNKKIHNNFANKVSLSTQREISAIEEAEASLLAVKVLAKDHVNRKNINRSKGKKTFTYIKAIEVCNRFSELYPKKLNIGICEYGVKAELGNKLECEMDKNENISKLKRKKTPCRETIDRNINQALKALNFSK